jgi:hypothetical protein
MNVMIGIDPHKESHTAVGGRLGLRAVCVVSRLGAPCAGSRP